MSSRYDQRRRGGEYAAYRARDDRRGPRDARSFSSESRSLDRDRDRARDRGGQPYYDKRSHHHRKSHQGEMEAGEVDGKKRGEMMQDRDQFYHNTSRPVPGASSGPVGGSGSGPIPGEDSRWAHRDGPSSKSIRGGPGGRDMGGRGYQGGRGAPYGHDRRQRSISSRSSGSSSSSGSSGSSSSRSSRSMYRHKHRRDREYRHRKSSEDSFERNRYRRRSYSNHRRDDGKGLRRPRTSFGRFNGENSQGKYQIRLCRMFIHENSCQNGNSCQFAHGEDELKPGPDGKINYEIPEPYHKISSVIQPRKSNDSISQSQSREKHEHRSGRTQAPPSGIQPSNSDVNFSEQQGLQHQHSNFSLGTPSQAGNNAAHDPKGGSLQGSKAQGNVGLGGIRSSGRKEGGIGSGHSLSSEKQNRKGGSGSKRRSDSRSNSGHRNRRDDYQNRQGSRGIGSYGRHQRRRSHSSRSKSNDIKYRK